MFLSYRYFCTLSWLACLRHFRKTKKGSPPAAYGSAQDFSTVYGSFAKSLEQADQTGGGEIAELELDEMFGRSSNDLEPMFLFLGGLNTSV